MHMKRAQKIQERTLYDYQKYIDSFVRRSPFPAPLQQTGTEESEDERNIKPATTEDLRFLRILFFHNQL